MISKIKKIIQIKTKSKPNPSFLKKIIKTKPVINSTIKYCLDIFFLQILHLNLSIEEDNNGILSYQAIFFLHFGQKDLSIIISKLSGNLCMQTFAKLPKINPNNIMKNSIKIK